MSSEEIQFGEGASIEIRWNGLRVTRSARAEAPLRPDSAAAAQLVRELEEIADLADTLRGRDEFTVRAIVRDARPKRKL